MALAALVLAACTRDAPEVQPTPATQAAPGRPGAPPDPRRDSRFIQIRTLLEQSPESQERSVRLYPLVAPLCDSAEERAAFLEVAAWSASHSDGENKLTAVLATDTLEHVATVCLRHAPEASYALLEEAKRFLPDTYKLDVVLARLRAARGELEPALEAAKRAAAQGSVHALALAANIQAERARESGPGYRAGMFDEAIATVSVEPDANWQLIDLGAVLSTRARLLSERAVWEDGAKGRATREVAGATYRRISVSPFIEAIRQRALDVLCFDAVDLGAADREACRRGAEEQGMLGAARAAGLNLPEGTLDAQRQRQLDKLAERIEALPPRSVVLVVGRGDEAELLEWVRPASHLLRRLAEKKPRFVAVDRTSSPRASALFQRMLELAEVTPVEQIAAKSDTFAMPCLTALVAGRKTPKACPFDAERERRLIAMQPYGLAVLVGRDLDAEIDDLRTYELETVLLSFRRSALEKAVHAWLKSTSDVLLFTPSAGPTP